MQSVNQSVDSVSNVARRQQVAAVGFFQIILIIALGLAMMLRMVKALAKIETAISQSELVSLSSIVLTLSSVPNIL